MKELDEGVGRIHGINSKLPLNLEPQEKVKFLVSRKFGETKKIKLKLFWDDEFRNNRKNKIEVPF